MQALICRDWRPFEELELDEAPPPALAAGGVRIKVRAVGLSFATGLVVEGRYQRKPPRPFIPGTEIAGTIAELAAGVEGFRVGDRVMAFIDWGGMADEAVVWAGQVYAVPDGLDFPEAIPLLSSYGTSYAALHLRAGLKPGETVLVHGAGGGVGLAAVEIAKARGATVIARAGSNAKRLWLAGRGADHVLDSHVADFRDEVLALTGGRGVELVYDPVGGEVFHRSLRCLDRGGRLLTIGYASGEIPELGANLLLLKNISVMGFNWGTYWGWSPEDERVRFSPERQVVMDSLAALWAEGAIRPKIHGVYPLSAFREAWDEVRGRRALGRVVLLPGS